MKLDIVRNTSRNIVFSIIKRLYGMIISFIMRTIMIYMMGVDYAGLNGIFTSLLKILSLAELGIGSAIVFSMYKPIAEDDRTKICALLNTYKKCYRAIGLIIMLLGVACLPFLSRLITGEIPDDLNIHILFMMHLLTTACSYSVFSYRSALFSAFQRTDVGSRVHMYSVTIKSVSQICVLFWLRNYYVYLAIGLASVLLENVMLYILTLRMYPEYRAGGKLSREETSRIIHHVKDLFLSKVGGAVVNSVDSIVISATLGLSMLGLYQNYHFIISSVSGVVIILYRSSLAGLGNRLAYGDTDGVFKTFENMSFALVWICGICMSCFLGLFQPFIALWVGSDMLLSYGIVIVFSVYFYIFQMMCLCSTYEDAAGIWHYGRFRPLLEAALNLALNLLLVRYIGLYGILLSTVISMACFSYPWLLRNLFKYIYRCEMQSYIKKMTQWSLTAFAVCGLSGLVNAYLPSGIVWIFVRGIICVLIPLAAFIAVYRKNPEFNWIIGVARKTLKKRKLPENKVKA